MICDLPARSGMTLTKVFFLHANANACLGEIPHVESFRSIHYRKFVFEYHVHFAWGCYIFVCLYAKKYIVVVSREFTTRTMGKRTLAGN